MNRSCCNLWNSNMSPFFFQWLRMLYCENSAFKPGSFYDYQSSWNDHYNPRIQCKTATFFTLQLLFFHLLPQGFSCRYNWSHYMNPNNAHLVSQKKKSLKDSLPIFWVSHLPKSSPVFVNGSLEIQPKNHQKTEKKNGAPFNSLNGCTEKRWRQSKFRRPSDGKKDQNLSFRAPKNQWKKGMVKWGPSINLAFFHGFHWGEISHPTYMGIISSHFFAGFWAQLV